MHYSPVMDAGIGALVVWGAIAFILFPIVVLVEAITLTLMKWDKFWPSLMNALEMNIISTIVGIILFSKLLTYTPGILEMLLSWAISVVIEGGWLWYSKKHALKFVLKAAFLPNVISYSGLLALYLYFSFVPAVPAFPEADIVFTPNSARESIGFVNQDGTNRQTLAFRDRFSKPVWMEDGKTLFLLQNEKLAVDFGDITMMKEGYQIHTCLNSEWWRIYHIAGVLPNTDKKLIINDSGIQLLLIDVQQCKELDTYVEVPLNQSAEIIGGSLSPDGKSLLFTRETGDYSNPVYSIQKMDLATKETVTIGTGLNPVWSPNGKMIAYLQFDGFYVMSSDGTGPKPILQYDLQYPGEESNQFDLLMPVPRWSPDGKWLIYHRWVNKNDAEIFKLNVATGEEIKVTEDGLYPYWRK